MSDLTSFRDHARVMSGELHRPECRFARIAPEHRCDDGCTHPDQCPGCVTDADRALWARLADEADAYLGRHVEEGLFA